MKKILLFLLFFVVGFVVKAQETKVDTIFIGKIKNESIKKYIKKKATVFILVRHGEKQYEGKNPSLSVEGKNRAQRLSALLKEVEIDNAFSTDFLRTKETIEPIVFAKNLKIRIYNPGKISDFVAKELSQNQSRNLIVGHSNTNPKLINEICKKSLYQEIPENKFNDFYVVNVFRNKIVVYHLLY